MMIFDITRKKIYYCVNVWLMVFLEGSIAVIDEKRHSEQNYIISTSLYNIVPPNINICNFEVHSNIHIHIYEQKTHNTIDHDSYPFLR